MQRDAFKWLGPLWLFVAVGLVFLSVKAREPSSDPSITAVFSYVSFLFLATPLCLIESPSGERWTPGCLSVLFGVAAWVVGNVGYHVWFG